MFFCHDKDRQSQKITLAEKIVQGGIKKLISSGEKIQIVQVEFKQGTRIPEHAHPEEQAGYIIIGKFEVNIGGEKGVLETGYYYWIPGNVPHSGYVYEDTILLDIYSPPRL